MSERILNPCNCEHAAHFPNDAFGLDQPEVVEAMKLPMLHEHLAVPAGNQISRYVGAVCDDCATQHLVGYIETDATLV